MSTGGVCDSVCVEGGELEGRSQQHYQWQI